MDGRRHRLRVWWAAPAAAVVLVVAALVAWALTGDRGTASRSAPPTGPAGATTGATTGHASSAPSRPSASASSKPPATTAPATSAPASTSDTAVPGGFVRYRDPTGFSIVIPAGWRRVLRGPRVDFTDPASGRFLRIDQTTHPKGDPYDDWVRQEKSVSQRLTDYHRIKLVRVSYRGWQAADWEFTFRSGSTTTHVLSRNIVPSAHRAYALYWSTRDSQWSTSDSQRILQIAEQTFTPAR